MKLTDYIQVGKGYESSHEPFTIKITLHRGPVIGIEAVTEHGTWVWLEAGNLNAQEDDEI